MSEDNANPLVDQHRLRPHFPLLLILFVGSGCAALIYEIVWFQLLELVIGSSAVSLGVLLGTYMGGMCLGSLLLTRVVSQRRHPLRVYALLETGIGICGVIVLFVVPHVARVYAANVGHGLPGILLRGVVCAVCLLPPTLLMGATLPAVARWVETTPRGVSWLGFFYGGNIAGAVFGCLLAGFYLLRVHDMAVATYIAVAINATVALVAFCFATGTPIASAPAQKTEMPPVVQNNLPVYLAIGISGLCALGSEVVWTRLLSLLLGPTVYAFSMILAVFLVGLGLGSGAGSFLACEIRRPRQALGWCQLFVVMAMGWTAYTLSNSLPFWPINPSLSRDPWLNFQLDLARCFWAMLPPAIFWGASFPLALAAAASPGQDPGKMVGRIYAANTAGAIVGAVGTSVLLIGWLGTRHAQQVLMTLSALAALVMFVPWPRAGEPESSACKSAMPKLKIAGAWLLIIATTVTIASKIPGVPWELVAFGRYLPTYNDGRSMLYLGEGLNASVAVTELVDGVRNFHVSGKVEASTDRYDMRLQRMLGHIPALIHPRPRSVLIVGCGAGVTAGSFTTYPGIERIVICEIEPLIPRRVAKFFLQENYNVTGNPRVQIVYDDARHYILTTREKFDIITSDPIHPWVKGAATLYTKEYFELVKEHLNPGGLVTQWVPLYESNSGVVKSEVATFFQVFTNGTIWGNESHGSGYDTIVLGSTQPLVIDVDQIQARLERTPTVAQSLHDVQFWSAIGLLATYAGRNSDLTPWLADAEINRDRNLRLQYLAGMASNLYREGGIYEEILSYRKFPDGLFAGSDDSKTALKKAIENSDQDTSR